MTGALRAAIDRARGARRPATTVYSPLRALGRHQLPAIDLLAQSLSTIAPATGMMFIALWVATQHSGVLGLATIAATTAGVVVVAFCITQFTRRLAAAGSLYSFVCQGLGPRAALATGAALLAGYFGIFVSVLAQGAESVLRIATVAGLPRPGDTVFRLGTAVLLALAVAVVTRRGARYATRAILVTESCSLVLITGLMLWTPAGTPSLSASASASPPLLGPLPVLAMLTVLSMAGFESAAFFGPEARRPLATVSRAVLVSPVVVGALFVFAACAALTGHAAVVLDAYFDGARSPAPRWLVLALDTGMAFSWLACTLGSAQAGSRLLYSMGVEHVLPRSLSRVHSRLRTPHAAVAHFVVAGLAGACVYTVTGGGDGAFDSVVETALVVAYTLVAFASLRFLRRIGEHTLPTLVAGGLVSVLGAGLIAVIAANGVLHGTWTAPVALALLASSGAVWHAVLRRVRPGSLDRIGAFDSVETADLLPGAGLLVLDAQGRRRIVSGPPAECGEERAG